MSQKVFPQSFSNSIPAFTQSLGYLNHGQTSFFPQNFVNFQPNLSTYNTNPQYSITTAKLDDEYKHFNMHLYDTQPGSAELNSPTTTAFTRCDSNKDDDQESLTNKTKSPFYRDIDHSPEGSQICMKREHEESHGSILQEKSKKILKRRTQRDPDSAKSSNRKSMNKGKRSSWSALEDARLMELMNTYGKKWSKIAALMDGRTGKQVRDRYVNVLMPDINRTGWEESEDQLILTTYQQIGPKWSKIAESLHGRTEGQVKNRFYSFLKKKFNKEEEDEKTKPNSSENTFVSIAENAQNWQSANSTTTEDCNMLQQCLQRVEEISQTSSMEQNKFQGMMMPQYPVQPSFFNVNPHQNEYFSGDFYCAPTLMPVSDPTDVISFEEHTYDPTPISYWADLENKMMH